ncbi:unnamed protein product [Schistosoma turkestanicum]|nr:unnamed protein product [Schistosoma turkestanicum]CAH8497638.1 unnamed protein product [Schistosoma turkestanicum]
MNFLKLELDYQLHSKLSLVLKIITTAQKCHIIITVASTSGIDGCSTCKFFVEIIYGQLQSNKTEDELRHLVKNACSILPGDFSDKCSELIDRYLDDIIKMIENNYPPEQICQTISLCPTVPSWSLSEQNPCLLGSTYWCRDYSTAKMCNAVQYCNFNGWTTYPPSNQNKFFQSQCELMKLAEICVNSELAKKCNRINDCYQEQVKNFLNLFSISTLSLDNTNDQSPCSVCVMMTTKWLLQWDLFGGPIINRSICSEYKTVNELQQCYNVVEKAGTLLINSRNDRQNVEQICARTINCAPLVVKSEQSSPVQTQSDDHQSMNANPDQLGHQLDLDKIACLAGPTYWCSSKEIAKKCNAINYCTDLYTPEIINPNDMDNNDKMVDNNHATTTTPSKTVKTKSEHMLGKNPCTWGPGYWCQSEQTAKLCGDSALEHCQTKVWLVSSSSSTSQKLSTIKTTKIDDKCTRGPSFWCASFENAKLCGQHAEWHCINVVWSNIHKSNMMKP